MARNSKRKINFTDGVKAEVKGQVVTFSGKKGAMDLNVHEQVSIESNEESILFSPNIDSKESITLASTMRSLAENIIEGVSKGLPHQSPTRYTYSKLRTACVCLLFYFCLAAQHVAAP